MKYELSELDVVWRKGDGEMPERIQKISNEAGEELFLRSLQIPDNVADAIRDNARESNKTITEYVSSLIMTSMQPVL